MDNNMNKNTFVKFVIFCWLALTVASCSPGNPNDSLYTENPMNVFHLEDSTVGIVRINSQNQLEAAHCTAFFVSGRRLATALHCVRPPIQMRIELAPGVSFVIPGVTPLSDVVGSEILLIRYQDHTAFLREFVEGNEDIVPYITSAHVISYDVDNDLAVLDLSDGERDATSWLALGTGRARVGEHVYSIGFPVGLFWIITDGIVSADHRLSSENAGSLLHTASITHGNSGGPLVNNSGQLVGINRAYVVDAGYLGVATPVEALRGLLENTAPVGTSATAAPTPTCRGQDGSCAMHID